VLVVKMDSSVEDLKLDFLAYREYVKDKIARVLFWQCPYHRWCFVQGCMRAEYDKSDCQGFKLEMHVLPGSNMIEKGYDFKEVLDRVVHYQQFDKFDVCLYKKDDTSEVRTYELKVGTFKMAVSNDVTRVEITLKKKGTTVPGEGATGDSEGYDTVN
jgi:hypothetical protein